MNSCCVQHVGEVYEQALQCGQISKEESEEFLSRSCSARTPVGIMETLRGKASAPSAGERKHVQLEPPGRTTQGNTHWRTYAYQVYTLLRKYN